MKKSFIPLLLALMLLSGCNYDNRSSEKFYPYQLIDYLNDNLNEPVIQDGFSPPVAGRIYAYCNLAAYEAYNYSSTDRIKLAGVLNDFLPAYTFDKTKPIDRDCAMFHAFCLVAKQVVYRDFMVDSFYQPRLDYFKQLLEEDVYNNSEELGKDIAREVVRYASTDNYKKTRSYPLFTRCHEASCWEPTTPMYGSAVEPYWGIIRPFIATDSVSFVLTPPVDFDSINGTAFYELGKEVYEASMSETAAEIAKFWDGDAAPPQRLQHLVFLKRQLNPVGHWLSIGKTLNHVAKKNELESLETYLKVAIGSSDGLIVCWRNKYLYNLIRPQSYISRYVQKDWYSFLPTPLFPEYPSGHSTIAGASSGILKQIFGDEISFTDSTQVRFELPARTFTSITQAANECAESRLLGGVHFRPAITEGIVLGKKVADVCNSKLHRPQLSFIDRFLIYVKLKT